MLHKLGFEPEISERVQYLIAHHHTYNNIDGIDYQILIEADFLVNMYEDNVSNEAVLNTDNIFRFKYGKQLCRIIWFFDFTGTDKSCL